MLKRLWPKTLDHYNLRNLKGFAWNHKRVYRICRQLALNIRIKPKKRIVREKSEALVVSKGINQR